MNHYPTPDTVWSDPVAQRLGSFPPVMPDGWLLRAYLGLVMPRPGRFQWSAQLLGGPIAFPVPGGPFRL